MVPYLKKFSGPVPAHLWLQPLQLLACFYNTAAKQPALSFQQRRPSEAKLFTEVQVSQRATFPYCMIRLSEEAIFHSLLSYPLRGRPGGTRNQNYKRDHNCRKPAGPGPSVAAAFAIACLLLEYSSKAKATGRFSMHPAFSNGFLIEIQYTAIVFNRAQRAPMKVFSMHPAFSNGFLIEIQYTAIVL